MGFNPNIPHLLTSWNILVYNNSNGGGGDVQTFRGLVHTVNATEHMGAGQWRSWTNLVTGTRSLGDLIPQRVLVHFDSRIMVRTMNNQQHKTMKVF